MIVNPDSFHHIMLMDIPLDLRSRLNHSHVIMKRYMRDVGMHLQTMGKDTLWQEKEPGRSGQASSSTDTLVLPEDAAVGVPPGLRLPETSRVQNLLEEALVELRPVLGNLRQPGRARNKAQRALNDCTVGWRVRAVACALDGGGDFNATTWILRSVKDQSFKQVCEAQTGVDATEFDLARDTHLEVSPSSFCMPRFGTAAFCTRALQLSTTVLLCCVTVCCIPDSGDLRSAVGFTSHIYAV